MMKGLQRIAVILAAGLTFVMVSGLTPAFGGDAGNNNKQQNFVRVQDVNRLNFQRVNPFDVNVQRINPFDVDVKVVNPFFVNPFAQAVVNPFAFGVTPFAFGNPFVFGVNPFDIDVD
jgi:hypothetical protein